MITEHALLNVVPGQESEFEAAFAEARPLVERMPGCRSVTIAKGIEHASDYLLLIQWDSVEAHEVGFRGSPEYQKWKALLHRFYEPFPVVEHFQPLN